MTKALFLDLDGTVITTKTGRTFPLHSEDWKFIPETINFIKEKVREDYIPIIVTNQAGIESGYITEEVFVRKINSVCNRLEYFINKDYNYYKNNKVVINYWYCKYLESYNRKPNIGMAVQAADEYELNLSECIMVGDMETDKQFAFNAGIRTYYDINVIKSKYSASKL